MTPAQAAQCCHLQRKNIKQCWLTMLAQLFVCAGMRSWQPVPNKGRLPALFAAARNCVPLLHDCDMYASACNQAMMHGSPTQQLMTIIYTN